MLFLRGQRLGCAENLAFGTAQFGKRLGSYFAACDGLPFDAVDQVGMGFHLTDCNLHEPALIRRVEQAHHGENQAGGNECGAADKVELGAP